ncbi:hypothetical protein AX16_003911 [Volvariella volvacea WC 439]|nr:hypothetical protein AX16_003911 [Volvariella volvacea WC 439]
MDALRIQLLSDLHLEIERFPREDSDDLYKYSFPAKAKMLALLGDIGWTRDDRLFEWIRIQLTKFKTIFFVRGNHEAYRSTIAESEERLTQFATTIEKERETSSKLGRFVFLNRTRFDISKTVTILGCTLWASLNPDDLEILRWALSDFRTIADFNPTVYRFLHEQDLAWLNSTVQQIANDEPDRRLVIFTHHAPTVLGTSDPMYLDGPTSSGYATELVEQPCWGSNVKVWAFGHTHWCCDFVREGVRVVSNQRGYKDKIGSGFDPEMVLEL